MALDKQQSLVAHIHKLAKQSAFYYQENKTERIGEGNHWKVFINTYNQRSQDYSDYGFISNEPGIFSFFCWVFSSLEMILSTDTRSSTL
jgi:hypothetical protein